MKPKYISYIGFIVFVVGVSLTNNQPAEKLIVCGVITFLFAGLRGIIEDND